jgi:hypothetical protein
VLEYVNEIESGIQDELDVGGFEPFFGEPDKSAPGIETARKWCGGFLAAAVQKEIFPKSEKPPEDVESALIILAGLGFPEEMVPKESLQKLKKAIKDPQALVSDCVYVINNYWREWDAAHEDNNDEYIEETFVREVPKTGRNVCCPGGSGKQYKRR